MIANGGLPSRRVRAGFLLGAAVSIVALACSEGDHPTGPLARTVDTGLVELVDSCCWQMNSVVVNPTMYFYDQDQRGVPGLQVRLSVSSGGTISDTVVTTDSNGRAQAARWTLGPGIGLDTLTMRAGSFTAIKVVSVSSGPPAAIVVDSAIFQGAPDSIARPFIGRSGGQSLKAKVEDAQGRGVPQVRVIWTDDQTGDTVCTPSKTLGDGSVPDLIYCKWRLGSQLGTQTSRLTVGPASAQMTATVVPPPTSVAVVSNPVMGDVQAGAPAADDVVVRLQPAPGQSAGGYLVYFQISGTSSYSTFVGTAFTDDSGMASFRLIPPRTFGRRVVRSVVAAYPTMRDSVSALVYGQPIYVGVSAGASHTCATSAMDPVIFIQPLLCWGRNAEQELADSTTVMRTAPVMAKVPPAWYGGIVVAAGGVATSSCAAYDNPNGPGDVSGIFRQVVCWGGNGSGQVGVAPSAREIPTASALSLASPSVGATHACAVHIRVTATPVASSVHFSYSLAADSVVCWGDNQYGELGDGTHASHFTGATVHGIAGTPAVVGAGDGFTCAADTTGQAFCWGHNAEGQLGDDSHTDRSIAAPVRTSLRFAPGARFSVGKAHVCAIGTDGRAYCWGRNAFAQLGDGTQTSRSAPVAATTSLTFGAIAAGGEHTCAIATSGDAYCWGDNDHGQLGTGTTGGVLTSPTPVVGGLKFQAISAGGAHTCGVTTDHRIFCWGSNSDGQLGDGTTTDHSTPVQVSDYRPSATAAASMNRARKR
jgi:hypothetical protein